MPFTTKETLTAKDLIRFMKSGKSISADVDTRKAKQTSEKKDFYYQNCSFLSF